MSDRRAVCVDVMGTVFDLSSVGRRLEALGAPALTLEAWFGRLLHSAATLTVVGEFQAFPDIAWTTLRSVLAQLDLDPEGADEVLQALAELEPHPEADAALARLAGAGLRVVALTNGSEQNTRVLLERSGLDPHVERIIATAEVGAYKPHRAVYDHAVSKLGMPAARVTLIAAHGWDVVGALNAGLDAIWVSRLERLWPLPVPQPNSAPDLEAAADILLGAR